jgi:hypothetical protein
VAATTVPWYEPNFGSLVAAVGVVVAAVTLTNALFQAYRAQTWKRKEFVVQRMETFFGDAAVRIALTILDYNARRLDLSRKSDDPELKNVRVDHWLAAAALIPHQLPDGTLGRESFTRVEIAIRDAFDEFLERLDKFYSLLEAGVLKLEDILPYLGYWLESIADTEKFLQDSLRRSLWLYIEVYEFTGVQKLCAAIDHPIIPSADDTAELVQEINAGNWDVVLLRKTFVQNVDLAAKQLQRLGKNAEAANFAGLAKEIRATKHAGMLRRELPGNRRRYIEYLANRERRDRSYFTSIECDLADSASKVSSSQDLFEQALTDGLDPWSEQFQPRAASAKCGDRRDLNV